MDNEVTCHFIPLENTNKTLTEKHNKYITICLCSMTEYSQNGGGN